MLSLGQQFLTKQSGEVSDQHVMISYNHSHRPAVINIHKRITSQGLKVWIDIDDMHGSTFDAMAKAVENAAIIVICYSPQYKNSDNCRAEAEYAFKLKKKALFLKMVADYDPDGWLGLILGSKLFYDFSGKYPFDKKITELIKAIHLEYNQADTLDGLVEQAQYETKTYAPVAVSTTSANASNILMPGIEAVKNWTAEQMAQWLDENEIPRYIDQYSDT